MADPHIQSPLDFWDYLTVILYRLGFTLAPAMFFVLPFQFQFALNGLLLVGVLLASSLHIYLKPIRLTLQFAVWSALLLSLAGLPWLALGAVFITIGGLGYKEYFCFLIIGLNGLPFFVAGLWFTLWFGWRIPSIVLSFICAGLLLILSYRKWKMPLHFDIGDKTKYQI